MKIKVPFSKFVNDVEVHSNVSDVLDGEDINQVAELESEFASYIGVDYALATSHGTDALHLAMLALDLKRGDKILCSVNAHPNVPEVVRHFDAEPVFLDINEQTYNINLDHLESYLEDNKSKKLKAVIVTHIAGRTVDLDRLYAIAKIYKIRVVEDASDALGATFNGDKIGSTGADITCFDFSSHLKKNVCNGGMLVTNDEEVIKRARLLHNHGMQGNEGLLEYIYEVVDIGNDYSLSELNAAYIRAQVAHQDENILRQKKIAKIYNESLKSVDHITIPELQDDEHPFSLYIIKIDKNRDSFAVELREAGIETALHYIPLHLLTYYKSKYSLRVNDFPVALRTYQQVLSLPIYASMDDKDVKFVCDKIKKIASNRV
ncbi:MAG: DegT/DnrJ/EryC1/StrS family aminotransferase [Campylobacterota bacterium]|nr:DegT/DnrJ/EryC1/StrS family aminotransferase [Campylobacterota bacterium]